MILSWIFVVTLATGIHAETGTWVDMSHPFSDSTQYLPGFERFHLTNLIRGRNALGNWVETNEYGAHEHGGTHMDAPSHYSENGWALHEIPIERFVAPAVVVDVTTQAVANSDYELTVADLQDWERQHGEIPDGAVVFLNSNWASRFSSEELFFGNSVDNMFDLHFPGFSLAAAQWLGENRNIYGLGTDAASLDSGASRGDPVHVYLLAREMYFLEMVNNLDMIPPVGATVYSFPMKIQGGSGGPARVMALLPDETNVASSQPNQPSSGPQESSSTGVAVSSVPAVVVVFTITATVLMYAF